MPPTARASLLRMNLEGAAPMASAIAAFDEWVTAGAANRLVVVDGRTVEPAELVAVVLRSGPDARRDVPAPTAAALAEYVGFSETVPKVSYGLAATIVFAMLDGKPAEALREMQTLADAPRVRDMREIRPGEEYPKGE